MAASNSSKVLLIFLSTIVAQGACAWFTVPDFVTKGMADATAAVGGLAGLDVDEGYRAGCQTAGYYNTVKAREPPKGGASAAAAIGGFAGALGNAMSSEDSKKDICRQHGFYDENIGKNAPPPPEPIIIYDPPVIIYDDDYEPNPNNPYQQYADFQE